MYFFTFSPFDNKLLFRFSNSTIPSKQTGSNQVITTISIRTFRLQTTDVGADDKI